MYSDILTYWQGVSAETFGDVELEHADAQAPSKLLDGMLDSPHSGPATFRGAGKD